MRVKQTAVAGLALSMILCGFFVPQAQERKTEVVIIGTFHHNHYIMSDYHPDTLRYLLRISQPDVLALELREKDLTDPEYGRAPADITNIAIPWAKDNGVPFEPVDWWTDEGVEERRAFFKELRETEEGRDKLAMSIGEFDLHKDKFEDWTDMTVAYVHSPEFAEKNDRFWKMQTDIFGEGPGNMYWYTRAARMNELLAGVIARHPGERIVVVTGAAHRGDFEKELAKREDVNLISVPDLPGVDSLPAYGGGGGLDEYRRILSQFVQGMKANEDPDSVDVDHVEKLLQHYKQMTAGQPDQLPFTTTIEAECAYLRKDYQAALEKFEAVRAMPGAREIPFFWTNLKDSADFRAANMLDLLGRRDEALALYKSILDDTEHSAHKPAERFMANPYTRTH